MEPIGDDDDHTQAAATTTLQTSLAMDPEEKKQVQSNRDQLKGHSFPDGGDIVYLLYSSSSEFNATNNRASIFRQYESDYTAFGYTAFGRKFMARDYEDIIAGEIEKNYCTLLEDLRQEFVCVCSLKRLLLFVWRFIRVSIYTLLAIYLLGSKVPPPPEAQYPYPNQYPYPYPYQYPNPPENLEQYFCHKRADAAAILGVSVSTLKRMCRQLGITQWPYRKGSSGSVSRPPDQHGERNTSTAGETPSHNVQTGIEGVPVGQNQEANEFRRDFTEGSIPLNSENGLITGSSFGWASQVNDQSTLSTPYPNHDALGFPPPQITLMPSENRGASIDLRNSAEPDRHISGFSNLTFATCSDQAAPSQHVGGQAMQSTDHNAFVFPQTQMVSPQEPFPDFTEGSIPLNTENGLIIGSSSGRACQVNDQSTLSTPYPIHDALVFPPPQMTSLPSENWGGSIDLMMSVASQAEPFSDGQISGFRNFATCFYQAAPSQHVGGQAMQSTDHNAFLFPQTQMVSPQEPSPAGHVFEFSNWKKHTNSVKIKAIYREHTKFKFLFPLTSGIDDLKKEVSKRLNVEVDRLEVKYTDEYGDLISLPFDADWMLCLLSSQGNDEIRVFVFDKDSELL